MPAWSATGDGLRNPDLIASGRSIASYRVPGSTVDTGKPTARYGTDLFLGSGTSQSAAVTTGVAAHIVQANPGLTPDEVKATLTRNATDLSTAAPERDGNGMLQGYHAASRLDTDNATQTHPAAAGTGYGIVTPTGSTWSGGTWSGKGWS